MKNPSTHSILLGCCLALVARAAPPPDLFEPALKEWLGQNAGGVAAAHIDPDGVTFFNAGRFDGADSPAITPDTQFEIGSVTKVFTALLLADTIRAGKIKLSDPVGAPFAPSAVTYEQLATHTAGLPQMPANIVRVDPLNPTATETVPDLVQAFDALSGGLKPAPSNYSNFGFAVLGQAVAGAWGQPYEQLLETRVLRPLGLHDTVTSWRLADATRLAPPHAENGPMKNWDLNAMTSAGALVSTSRDLAKFVQVALGLTSTALQEAMAATLQSHASRGRPGQEIGLAWHIEKQGPRTVYWHNGGTGGYRSFIAFDAAQKTGVVLITNRATSLDTLGMSLLAGRRPPVMAPSTAPAEHLKEYLGRYPLLPTFVMVVAADGEQLFVQATGQSRLTLLPLTADRYSVKGVTAEVWFERDAVGKIVALVLHQNGRDQRAVKAE